MGETRLVGLFCLRDPVRERAYNLRNPALAAWRPDYAIGERPIGERFEGRRGRFIRFSLRASVGLRPYFATREVLHDIRTAEAATRRLTPFRAEDNASSL